MFTIPYEEYTSIYHGKLSEEDFDNVITKAVVQVDDVCYNRVLELSKEDLNNATYLRLVLTICEVVDIITAKTTEEDPSGNSSISSESVGSWKTVYNNKSITSMSMKEAITTVASKYLDGTPLRCAWV